MRIKFTLLAAAASMLLAAQAQTLTFNMGNDEGAVILNKGKFNPYGRFIGNTSEGTVIQVGTVDFGSGDAYKSVSIRFANGWSNGGYAILSAGATYAEAVPFTQIALINFRDSYQNFRSIGANFAGGVSDVSELSGGQLAREDLVFTNPTGKQNVYLTFVGRAGNIMDVRFYDTELAADYFESGSMLKEPRDLNGYAEVSAVLPITGATLVTSPSADTRIDGDSWGWTQEGVVVNYGTVDFGDEGFDQVILGVASHWNGDVAADNIDVYVDDVENAANLLATVWTGIEIRNGKIYLARNIESTVTGEHTVFLVWHGGSTNVSEVEFCHGELWSLGNRVDTTPFNAEKVNEQPSDKAVRYSFLNSMQDSPNYIGRNSNRTTILNQGQWEDDNVGYTGDGTVLRIEGFDFQDGQFDKMLVSHSTGNNDPSYVENYYFKFYIDLEADASTGAPRRAPIEDWGAAPLQLADVEPIATVQNQPTGGWGTVMTTKGELSRVMGEHTVYILYGGDGANIKDIYLDDQVEDPYTGIADVQVAKTANGNVYSIDGRLVKKGATSLDGLDKGIYIFNGEKHLVK